MRIITGIAVLILFFFGSVLAADNEATEQESIQSGVERATYPQGIINLNLAAVAYSGGESFRYDISWTGGIKIGELILQINTWDQCPDCYEIQSTVTTSGGIIHRLYPLEDKHITLVKGRERLPYFGDIRQRQGKNYRAHKTFRYDQETFSIFRQKEGEEAEIFHFDGVVHNEFSAFFASRVMNLEVGRPLVVPTFGDEQRHEVVVETEKIEVIEKTVLGRVTTLKVTPVLTFSGLYDKRGDTSIWYTDDECRVPVRIQSKIVIGSLTADLVRYQSPLCIRYNGRTMPH